MILLGTLLQGMAMLLIAARMHAAPRRLKAFAGGRTRVAIIGWALLAASFGCILAAGPFGLMLLTWCGLLTLSAGAVLLLSTLLREKRPGR